MESKGRESEIERLPVDLLSHILVFITCFKDLAQASSVCKKWRQGVKQSLGRREKLSFGGWNMDDDSTTRILLHAYSLKELDISKSRWGCQITDKGLYQISLAKCISNLSSISLWGMTEISDNGLCQLDCSVVAIRFLETILHVSKGILNLEHSRLCLVSRATSLQHLNIGGTFITDESLFTIANSCPHLKSINLWCCRHVTEHGLLVLVNKCHKLESINVWGMRVPMECFICLVTISPALHLQPEGLLPLAERSSLLPVF